MPELLPASLHPDRLMTHMHVQCKEIGPRPPASEQKRRAARYTWELMKAIDD